MTNFIKIPNLPNSNVKLVLAGKLPKILYNEFSKLNINIITLDSSKQLQAPVKSHADMLCHHLGNNKLLLTKENNNITNELSTLDFDIQIIKEDLKPKYPYDILLNAARLNNKLICNKSYIAQEIIDYCEKYNVEIINVQQGYSKCSICIVNDNAIITEDKSIFNECINNKIDALLIEKGFVDLPGYDYGFIGGCSFLISKHELAFSGKIESHPDFNNIKSFLLNYNVNPISLTNNKLIDIGGVIPLIEECK